MGEFNKEIGSQIRLARELKGYSQEAIATFLGISQQAYRKLECGETRLVDDRLEQIVTFLDISIEELSNINCEKVIEQLINKSFIATTELSQPPEEAKDHILKLSMDLEQLKKQNAMVIELLKKRK